VRRAGVGTFAAWTIAATRDLDMFTVPRDRADREPLGAQAVDRRLAPRPQFRRTRKSQLDRLHPLHERVDLAEGEPLDLGHAFLDPVEPRLGLADADGSSRVFVAESLHTRLTAAVPQD
jgi:hypothetical protein